MKKDNKSDYAINFTRKALSYLGKHTSLEEPEAVKMLIAELKASDGYKRSARARRSAHSHVPDDTRAIIHKSIFDYGVKGTQKQNVTVTYSECK
jgi:hypothetical protein